jgi:acylphosphatase
MGKGISITIRGRVQGVGFRNFTQMMAVERGITGWVKNTPDGGVEVLAFGSVNNLEQFMQVLKEGCLGSKVTEFHSQWVQDEPEGLNFLIRY